MAAKKVFVELNVTWLNPFIAIAKPVHCSKSQGNVSLVPDMAAVCRVYMSHTRVVSKEYVYYCYYCLFCPFYFYEKKIQIHLPILQKMIENQCSLGFVME